MLDLSLDAQIRCVRREIIRRAEVMPELLDTQRIIPQQAQSEQQLMVAVLDTLQQLQKARQNYLTVLLRLDDAESGIRLPARDCGNDTLGADR